MIKQVLAIKCGVLLSALLLLTCFADSQGFLHTEGTRIVDGNGREILLRGVGLGGWMLQEPYELKLKGVAVNQRDIKAKIAALIGKEKTEEFYNEWLKDGMQKSDIDSLKEWGFNSVRLPLHYDLFTLSIDKEPVPGKNTWLQKGFTLTDSLLSWCKSDHIYLILDLHATPGGQGHDIPISDRDSSKPSLWQSNANQQKTIALWKRIADHYKNEKWIGGYDLMDEPNWSFVHPADKTNNGCDDTLNGPLRKLYVEITQAIRSVDQHHIIYVEGNCWASSFKGLLPPWDDNLVYTFHKYWDKNNVASIRKYLNVRQKYNVPLWDGESGENTNKWFRNAVRLLERNDIGWNWWPLKKMGDNNPFEVIMPAGFQQIINYWKGNGPKPSVNAAYHALIQLAESHKTENLIVHHDVLNALFQKK